MHAPRCRLSRQTPKHGINLSEFLELYGTEDRSGSRELDRDCESVAELADELPRGNDARVPHALKSQQISLVSGHEVVRRAGEYAVLESGLGRFVHLNKGDFIGRDALHRWMERGFTNRLVTLEVHDATDADPLGNNPVFAGRELVGRATGGNYGFRVGKSLALAMVRPDFAESGTALEIDVLGTMHRATVEPPRESWRVVRLAQAAMAGSCRWLKYDASSSAGGMYPSGPRSRR